MKFLYLNILCFLISVHGFSQFTLSNEKVFGGSLNDGLSEKFLVNNHFYLFGTSNSDASGTKSDNSFGEQDAWLVCTDLDYNILWDTVYGGNDYDQLFAVQQDADGFYLVIESQSGISGNKTTSSFGSSDIWYLHIDFNGNVVSQFSYGGNLSDRPNYALIENDEIIVLSTSLSDATGNKTTINFGSNDYWLLKINKNNGQIINQKSFGTSNDESFGAKNIRNDNNSFLLLGSAAGNDGNKNVVGFGGNDIWLLELDLNFNIFTRILLRRQYDRKCY